MQPKASAPTSEMKTTVTAATLNNSSTQHLCDGQLTPGGECTQVLFSFQTERKRRSLKFLMVFDTRKITLPNAPHPPTPFYVKRTLWLLQHWCFAFIGKRNQHFSCNCFQIFWLVLNCKATGSELSWVILLFDSKHIIYCVHVNIWKTFEKLI